MSSAPKYLPHYTVADYEQWSGDWELWQGIAIAMTPSPFGRHQLVGANLVRLLGNALHEQESACHVLYEIDWIVTEDTVVRPDLVITCGEVPERHLTSAPTLVIEILSSSTADKDRTVKRELYQREGVQHYWIADPDRQTMQVLTLQDSVYQEHPVGSTLTLDLGESQIVLTISDIW